MFGTQKAHKHEHFYRDIPTLLGFMIRDSFYGISLSLFLLMCFFGALPTCLGLGIRAGSSLWVLCGDIGTSQWEVAQGQEFGSTYPLQGMEDIKSPRIPAPSA